MNWWMPINFLSHKFVVMAVVAGWWLKFYDVWCLCMPWYAMSTVVKMPVEGRMSVWWSQFLRRLLQGSWNPKATLTRKPWRSWICSAQTAEISIFFDTFLYSALFFALDGLGMAWLWCFHRSRSPRIDDLTVPTGWQETKERLERMKAIAAADTARSFGKLCLERKWGAKICG
jgi:hypothetical protein